MNKKIGDFVFELLCQKAVPCSLIRRLNGLPACFHEKTHSNLGCAEKCAVYDSFFPQEIGKKILCVPLKKEDSDGEN